MMGIRRFLHWKNNLRFYGQSKNCCPEGFYDYQIYSAAEAYPFVSKSEKNNVKPRTLNLNNFQKLPCDSFKNIIKKKTIMIIMI